jgi:hypothetical protein
VPFRPKPQVRCKTCGWLVEDPIAGLNEMCWASCSRRSNLKHKRIMPCHAMPCHTCTLCDHPVTPHQKQPTTDGGCYSGQGICRILVHLPQYICIQDMEICMPLPPSLSLGPSLAA